jgi:hypothetical protein
MPRDAGDDAYEELANERRAAARSRVEKLRDGVQARLKAKMSKRSNPKNKHKPKKLAKRSARKQSHVVERVTTGGHSDQYRCSCGWVSNAYWDLEEAAMDEWLLHARDTKTEIRPVFYARQQRLVDDRDRRLTHLKEDRKRLDARIAALEPKRSRR